MRRKLFITLFTILSITVFALPWGHRYSTEQNWQNNTIPVGNTLTFSVEWGEGDWVQSDIGYGTSTDGSGWTWVDISWFEDGDGSNKRCKTDIQFNTAGTFYYAYRLEKPASTIGYQHGSDSWSENASTLSAISSVIVQEPLPVTLSTFSAVYVNNTLNLSWTTQSETNNIGWNVYRSETENLEDAFRINGEIIAGAGTVSEPTNYTFTDDYPVISENSYWYWLESNDVSGLSYNYDPITLTIPANNEDNPIPPNVDNPFALYNIPNPFTQSTEIRFIPQKEGYTEITIYNTKGQKIISLFNDNINESELDQTIYINWDGLDESGKKLLSGIYFSSLKVGNSVYTKKIMIIK